MAGGQAELQQAIFAWNRFVPVYVNLADVYRGVGRATSMVSVCSRRSRPYAGKPHAPLSARFGLTRLNRGDTALREFARAASLEPGNARFSYVHAIALHSAGKVGAAIATLGSHARRASS
jgi:Flp pilus assembly protein TadD